MKTKLAKSLLLATLLLGLCFIPSFAKPRARRLEVGTWGGPHIHLEVAKDSATIEYDCAHGTINGPLMLDRRGRFSYSGTYSLEHGGPIRMDEKPNARPVRYAGVVSGKTMKLTVTFVDANEEPEVFTLVLGGPGRVFKCR